MRRSLVFTLAAGMLFFAASGVVACGGNDKPPLTPDSLEAPAGEASDAGAPSTPSTPSTATPPAK